MKVEITECKSLAEWFKRCGPYDYEKIALDLLTGVPLPLHEAVHTVMRAYTAWNKGGSPEHRKEMIGRIMPSSDGIRSARGPRFLDDYIRDLTKKPVPRAVGEMIYKEVNAGKALKRKNRPSYRTISWPMSLRASSYWSERNELVYLPRINIDVFTRGIMDMGVHNRLEYKVIENRIEGDDIVLNVLQGDGGVYRVEVYVPRNMGAKMAMREPTWFSQYVKSPSKMTITGEDIPTAKRALILSRKVIGYVGVATPRNAISEVKFVMDAGPGSPPKVVEGLQFSRHFLARHQEEMRLDPVHGNPTAFEYTRADRLFKNYYVTDHPVLIQSLRNMLKRRGR
jgi:hypothetical protein